MPQRKPDNLKEAIIDEAFAAIEEKGVENLSFRDIARRLGVTHQAPYKHFPSRDHILAAVIARCFEGFSKHLDARPKAQSSAEDLHNMGLAYLDFAQTHPVKYRLMFNTPLPPPQEHPEMMGKSNHAFKLLTDRLSSMELRDLPGDLETAERHDAIFIWSALHGLASLLQSNVMDTLDMSEDARRVATERLFQRLSIAFDP